MNEFNFNHEIEWSLGIKQKFLYFYRFLATEIRMLEFKQKKYIEFVGLSEEEKERIHEYISNEFHTPLNRIVLEKEDIVIFEIPPTLPNSLSPQKWTRVVKILFEKYEENTPCFIDW